MALTLRRLSDHARSEILSTLVVIVLAAMTLGLLAFLEQRERERVQTHQLFEDLEIQIHELNALQARVGMRQSATAEDAEKLRESRERIEADLESLQSRDRGHGGYWELDREFRSYLDALDRLVFVYQSDSADHLAKHSASDQAFLATIALAAVSADASGHAVGDAAAARRITVFGGGGAVVVLVIAVLGITRWTEKRLQRSRLQEERMRAQHERDQQFGALIQHNADIIAVVDPSGNVTYMSPSSERLTGYAPDEIVGRPALGFVHPDDVEVMQGALTGAIQRDGATDAQVVVVRVRRKDGSWAAMEAAVSNRLDVPGINGIVVNARDVTERQRIEEQMRYHALHDSLTGLANRRVLLEHLRKTVERSRRRHTTYAVMFIDLDNFKRINDTHGHDVGDDLLLEVAGRLRTVVRAEDTAARFGGDEFVVLLDDLPSDDVAAGVAERIHEALRAPFRSTDLEFFTSASIGVVLSSAVGDASIDDILRYADIAMYEAKRAGRNRTAWYSPDSDASEAGRLGLETALRHSLEREELHLVYQPLVDAATGQVVAVEALLRWESAELGSIPPSTFIPVAEETGLIEPIGQWVLRTACAQLAAWRDQFGEQAVPRICVNLSARQMQESGLTDAIAEMLAGLRLDGSWLTLEITESSLLGGQELARNVLERLHAMGIQIALDDFGTGYSSLAHVHDLPIDAVKIARSFTRDVTTIDNGRAIVVGIVQLGRALGMTSVVEGVETDAELAEVRAIGADLVQGLYFYPPMPAAEITALLTRSG